jgi:hypothetical protein
MPRGVKPDNFYKPKLSGSESKAQTTTNAAYAIAHEETVARKQKTERLRAARLAKEAAEPEQRPIKSRIAGGRT